MQGRHSRAELARSEGHHIVRWGAFICSRASKTRDGQIDWIVFRVGPGTRRDPMGAEPRKESDALLSYM